MDENSFKAKKEKFILGFLKYAAFTFNMLIIFGTLYGVTMYVLFLFDASK